MQLGKKSRILFILVGFPFLFLLMSSLPALAADVAIGTATRLQSEVYLKRNGQSELLQIGTSILLNDRIETGTDARLELSFVDGTKLTMGANAKIIIDEYVFNPDQGIGRIFFNILNGSFRMITGNIAKLKKKDVAVQTQVAYVGVREMISSQEMHLGNMVFFYSMVLLLSVMMQADVF